MLTKTENKIIVYLKNNCNSERNLTRSSISRNLKLDLRGTYVSTNNLKIKGYVEYVLINKLESKVKLTQKGELLLVL